MHSRAPPPSWQALAPAPSLLGATSFPRILLGLAGGGAVTALGVRPGEHHAQQTQHGDANQQDHTKPDDGEADSQKRPGDVEQHAVKDRTTPTMAPVNTASELASRSLPDTVVVRRGRVVFKARRPAMLVGPLAAVTELAGIICLVAGATIGWFIVAAPVATLLITALLFRPALELTRDGLVQRQYPFSSLTRWENIEDIGIARAGNRTVLAYKLVDGVPPPRRQPAAAMLRATGAPFDGGFFADALAGRSDDILDTVTRYLRDPELRSTLPPARR